MIEEDASNECSVFECNISRDEHRDTATYVQSVEPTMMKNGQEVVGFFGENQWVFDVAECLDKTSNDATDFAFVGHC